jgi:hypothetical protein
MFTSAMKKAAHRVKRALAMNGIEFAYMVVLNKVRELWPVQPMRPGDAIDLASRVTAAHFVERWRKERHE